MFVAVDVGGTEMKCALVGRDGVPRHRERHPTAGRPDLVGAILDVLRGLAERARATGYTPVAAGLVVPGIVDEARGVAVKAANVPLRDVPLRDLAADRLGLPAALGHDVRAGALAEARLGAARGADNVLFVPVGTGVAAAYVRAGTVLTGGGAAGELGHVVVRPGGPVCGCGARGCLEAVASAAAIARRAGTPAPDVVARAAAGDERAAAVWRDAVEALADGLAAAQALLDPDVVVVGGGLSRAGAALLAPLRAALRERLVFLREPRVVGAALGDEAGCLGAGLLAEAAR